MEKTGQMLRLQIFWKSYMNIECEKLGFKPLYASDDFFISYWNELNLNYPQIYT
jgi:hypothetical protein